MFLVVAMFVVVGVYVGYHVSQQAGDVAEEHGAVIEPGILDMDSGPVQTYQNPKEPQVMQSPGYKTDLY